jgi:4'-phosphopantetheinyl transferase EntD
LVNPSAADLLPGSVVLATSDMQGSPPPLEGEEVDHVLTANPRRRAEFAWGRACAREALLRLGHPAGALTADASRAPQWPRGVTGSISHCSGLCVAAVAPTTDLSGLGVDVEEVGALSAHLAEVLLTEGERRRVGDDGELGKLLFSAKESVFKCLSPPGGLLPDHCPLWSVTLAPDGTFTVESDDEAAAVVGCYSTDGVRTFTAAWLLPGVDG